MSNQKISQLNSLTKLTIAGGDLIPVVDISASETKKITFTELMNPLDSIFKISGSSDSTKQIRFEVDGITASTVRVLTVPDADMTLVGADTAQTLSQKILSSPQINFGGDTRGDLITRDASGNTVRLPLGSVGQIPSVSAAGDLEFIANPAASNADTSTKGVLELATQAEVDAGTAIGGTGASLAFTPATLRARLMNTGVADTGSSTAYAIAPAPAITAYAAYQEFTFKAANANTTVNPTLNVNSIGAKTIVNPDGTALLVGQIAAGAIVKCVYDGTNMQMVSITHYAGKIAYGQGSRTAATGPGTVTIPHGLGVTPALIEIFAQVAGGSVGAGVTEGSSFGQGNASAYSCTWRTKGASIAGLGGQVSNKIISLMDNTGGVLADATISALDNTNISLAFGNLTGTGVVAYYQWKAFL